MTLRFRLAVHDDVPAVVALLRDDELGQKREAEDISVYFASFEQMCREAQNHVVVGEVQGAVIACYQLTFISGLSLSAARRAQIEAVRVASHQRGNAIGQALIEDAEARARAAGCQLLQFTTNKSRNDAHRFYDRMGFTPSHIGYKKFL